MACPKGEAFTDRKAKDEKDGCFLSKFVEVLQNPPLLGSSFVVSYL